jgi:effector-binding domain-containing protein
MKGSYMQHPEAFERLGGFLAGKGVTPAGRPFARYFSDPSVGEDNLVWEVGFPVAAKVAAEAPFEIKDIPGGLTAVRVHTGPMEELGSAWGSFVQGLVASGYRPSGPATQIFQGDMFASPQVEMRIAVEKAQ